MIKNTNERIAITLTKKQVKWLKLSAKKLKMTVSKFIKWLLDRNLASLIRKNYNDYEIAEIMRIAKTPWIVNFDDDGIVIPMSQGRPLSNKLPEDWNPYLDTDDEIEDDE